MCLPSTLSIKSGGNSNEESRRGDKIIKKVERRNFLTKKVKGRHPFRKKLDLTDEGAEGEEEKNEKHEQ